MEEKNNDVIGLGSVLIDFLINVDDSLLSELKLNKGEMHLVDEEKVQEIFSKINQLELETSLGGSSANTIRGIGFLGGKAIFCGKRGYDQHGQIFIEGMQKHNVITKINAHPKKTGHVISFISPNAERTMSTHLGAAIHLTKEDISEEEIKKSKILHLEAYQLEGITKDVLLYAMELAKKHNTLISIDLADPGLIRRNKEFFKEIVTKYVDILFLNEEEAKEFTGLEEEQALQEVAKFVKIAIVKLGERGSLIAHQNKIIKIPSYPANSVDTTGAGDTYASGFLYAYTQGLSLEQAGKLGSLFAAKIVEEKGMNLKNVNADELKQQIQLNDKENIINNEDNTKMKYVDNKMTKIGIIGGSGLYKIEQLENAQDIEVETKFGKPSSAIKTGTINGIEVAFLARHGREHTIPPTEVNFRANIQALKDIGCTHILATTACGSLRREIGRGDLIIVDQFIDFTKHRKFTFYDEFKPGEHGHTPMAEPFNKEMRSALIFSAQELGLEHHPHGTVITIEGPRFSTKAESKMFNVWGADVINMSIAPEAALANEAGIPYAAVAMSTDYDCLFDDVEHVTHEEVLKVFSENVDKVIKLMLKTIPKLSGTIATATTVADTGKKPAPEFDLKSTIRTVPHWPKQGVMFRDITTLLLNPEAFNYSIQKFKENYQNKNVDKIVGIESRGFIFGAALAKELNLPFVLMRKPGKLPAETVAQEYQLEYGTDKVEIHKDAIHSGENILIIDDLLATGGTMQAACQLVEKLGGKVASCAFVVDLPDLKGREKLAGREIFHLVEFAGD